MIQAQGHNFPTRKLVLVNPMNTFFLYIYIGKKSHSIEDRNEYIIKQLSILDQKLASKVIESIAFFIYTSCFI